MKIEVVLRRSEVEDHLLGEVKRLRAENKRLQERLNEVELKYGHESYLNNELIDALRQRHIPFREIIDKTRNKRV